jgi:integrase
MLKENNQQKRYLTPAEIKRLLAVSPQHLQDVIICAINSGMRRTELLTLTWQQIKWDEGIIELPETKSDEPQEVTLNEPLINLFKRIRRRPIVDSKRVFIWQDFSGKWKPIKDATTAFKRACKAAGIKYGRPDHVTFHTLRHTYGSHLVMRGATIYEVRDLMRHVDVKTTERYAHLSDKAKRKAAELLDGLTG